MEDTTTEEALFEAALKLNHAARAAFLDQACHGNPALRKRLDLLLEGHFQRKNFLTMRIDVSQLVADGGDPAPHDVIDRYKLLEKIGEGGCGVVYVAEQTEPVRRRVALKVIKLGMDTRAVVARFEAERQALAMMDHPNIARVLDAGTTQLGRPYFVMELVRGIRITDYCDQNNLSTKERLDLFMKVCHAIQHAHQKGIIHRDIKPSNILVTLHDGVPVPKVIDFGIAKATEGRLTDATVYTQLHQFIGTPAYMSPEQAEMSGLDIDTRSDIYSLGVLLYELLIGTPPFDANELMARGVDEMRKTIREKEPVRPSTRLATLQADALTTTAKRRSVDSVRLISQLKGDLDWIVMKCLEKDRSRRYESASGLAKDLSRHLTNEPVAARPPSIAYRLQKGIRRNKLLFASSTAIALALLAASAISGWSWRRERNARMSEQAQREGAQAARAEAALQRDLAQERLLDSLIREMRSISTLRPLGYRDELRKRVRLALELPKASERLEEIRAEFSQALGDPAGNKPTPLEIDPPGSQGASTPLLALSPRGDVAAITRGKDVSIRATDTGTLLAQFPVAAFPFLGFSPDGQTLYRMIQTSLTNAYPFELIRWSRRGSTSWTYRQLGAEQTKMIKRICVTDAGVISIEKSEGDLDALVNLDTGAILARLPAESISVRQATDIAPGLGLVALGNQYVLSTALDVFSFTDPKRRFHVEPPQAMGRITIVQFSPDEKFLLCNAENGAFLLETRNFTEVGRLRVPQGADLGGAFIQNGAAIAFKGYPRAGLRLFSTTSGRESYVSTDGPVQSLAANSDGSMLIFADNAGVSVARFGDSEERRHLAGHIGGVTCAEFSPDGRILASTGKDGSIRLWDVESASLRKAINRPGAVGQTVSFSPDGQSLAVTDYQQREIQIISTETGKAVRALGESGTSRWGSAGAAFSPDGRYLLALGNGLRVWDYTTNNNPVQLTIAQKGQGLAADLQLDPAGPWFAFSRMTMNYRTARVFVGRMDSEFSVEPIEEAQLPGDVQAMAFVPARSQLAFTVEAAGSRELHFLDLNTKQIVRKLPLLQPGEKGSSSVFNLRFSADGARFATVSHDGRRVAVFDTGSGRRLYLLPAGDGAISWIAWHPDGKQLAVARDDGDLSLWDLPAVEKALADAGLAR
ncbi:MAG TPA: WD40 repeat domain-containing serine/threonine protein kinase [Verrucomicrobiae bacterium]|nr:WD40 repeat domain-containing serine/threonine protein kinase [Verrucomicrobiae bacterium]